MYDVSITLRNAEVRIKERIVVGSLKNCTNYRK